jgi:hypothetical protein
VALWSGIMELSMTCTAFKFPGLLMIRFVLSYDLILLSCTHLSLS